MLPVTGPSITEPPGETPTFPLEELVYDVSAVNLLALDEELRTALADDTVGLSLSADRLRVHVRRGTVRDRVDAVITAHDPARLTDAQQTDRDRAASLDRLNKPWPAWTPADKDLLLSLLATRLDLDIGT